MSGRQKIEEEYRKSKKAIALLAQEGIRRIRQETSQIESEAEKIGAAVEEELKEDPAAKKKS